MSGILSGLETAGKDVLEVVEEPVKFLVKAEKVIADAIKDQPEVKAAVLELVQQAETVIGDAGTVGAEKGINLADDAKALSDAETFFEYFKNNFIPVVEKVYAEVKADVS